VLKKERNKLTIIGVFLAIAVITSLLMLFLRPDVMGNDFSGHKAYLVHVFSNPLDPFSYTGSESWHPPSYYYLTAAGATLGEALGWSALKSARLVSTILYLIYIYFGLLTLRLCLSGWGLMAGALLLILWPSNLELATRLNSDTGVFPVYAATQYYLTRAFVRGQFNDCLRALAIAFLGLTIKTSALVPVALALLAMVGWRLLHRGSPTPLPNISTGTILKLLALLVVCVSINTSRLIFADSSRSAALSNHLGGSSSQSFSLSELLAFRPDRLIEDPFTHQPFAGSSVLEFMFRTALFTERPFFGEGRLGGQMWICLVLLQLVLLSICISAHAPKVIRYARDRYGEGRNSRTADMSDATRSPNSNQDWAVAIFLLALCGVAVGSLLGFAVLKRWIVCANYRFVQPSIIAWIALVFVPLQGAWTRPENGCGVGGARRLSAASLSLGALVIFLLKTTRLLPGW
jgi:hypothetical protein